MKATRTYAETSVSGGVERLFEYNTDDSHLAIYENNRLEALVKLDRQGMDALATFLVTVLEEERQ